MKNNEDLHHRQMNALEVEKRIYLLLRKAVMEFPYG